MALRYSRTLDLRALWQDVGWLRADDEAFPYHATELGEIDAFRHFKPPVSIF
jgi:hypothetical protein